MYDLFVNMELPLLSVLADMEHQGLRVNPVWLKEFQAVLLQEMNTLQAQIDARAGYPVNVNSPKQLGVLLF